MLRLAKDLTLACFCLAALARSIVGVAGGATKAAVAQHQVVYTINIKIKLSSRTICLFRHLLSWIIYAAITFA